MIQIRQDTYKSPGYLKRLAVSGKNSQGIN